MKLDFSKMQGCGNDYIYIDCVANDLAVDNKSTIAVRLSERHFGVGADGVIFINKAVSADFEMEMYNADGSRGEMCGNGIRCVAKYVFDHGYTEKECFTIESMGKIKYITVYPEGGKVKLVKVDMGEPILECKQIPAVSNSGDDRIISEKINVCGISCEVTCVSMGNPHAVIFLDSFEEGAPDLKTFDIERVGPYFENFEMFPKRTNTEFCRVDDAKNVTMRVWERGTGETLACGTGCCAICVAGVLNNRTDHEITVHVTGGEISVFWNPEDNHVYMTGPADYTFTGSMEI